MKNKNTFKGHRLLLLIVVFLCVFPCKEYYAKTDSKRKIEITKCPKDVKTGENFTLKGTADIPNHQYLWVQILH